ncbi:hypothetical protein F6P94_02760 [Escherichia coli]|nr:hypothetical protein F6P94_02760 [Escherichia coli]
MNLGIFRASLKKVKTASGTGGCDSLRNAFHRLLQKAFNCIAAGSLTYSRWRILAMAEQIAPGFPASVMAAFCDPGDTRYHWWWRFGAPFIRSQMIEVTGRRGFLRRSRLLVTAKWNDHAKFRQPGRHVKRLADGCDGMTTTQRQSADSSTAHQQTKRESTPTLLLGAKLIEMQHLNTVD